MLGANEVEEHIKVLYGLYKDLARDLNHLETVVRELRKNQ